MFNKQLIVKMVAKKRPTNTKPVRIGSINRTKDFNFKCFNLFFFYYL